MMSASFTGNSSSSSTRLALCSTSKYKYFLLLSKSNRDVKPSNFAVGRTPQVSFCHGDDQQNLGHGVGADDDEEEGIDAEQMLAMTSFRQLANRKNLNNLLIKNLSDNAANLHA